MSMTTENPELTPPERSGSDPQDEDRAAPGVRVRNAAIGLGVVALLVGLLAVLAAGHDPAAEPWSGTVLGEPEHEPAIVLEDTSGETFDLRTDTDAKVTLLMFGYTSCPDFCPISLGTLQAALDELGPGVSNQVQLVFVTADPERDTAKVLRDYLDGFNADFIGLRGTETEVDEAQRMANVPPAVRDAPDETGEYSVGHASQIIAYQDDDMARVVYPFGTRQQDWIRDLPRLIEGEHPST